jgi:hypothetical protein
MATQPLKNSPLERLRVGLMIAAAAVFFVAFSFWSGVPGGEKALPFWIGVAVLVGVLAAFGFATWHLLFRPLPAGQVARVQTFSANLRQSLALLLGISGLSIIVGLFWDEVWHRIYGVPFGDDFFWRPHLLMYFGFFSVTALAFIGLYSISRGKGTFQQRFRANPLVGMLILLGAFLMYVLAADPIWHAIYGVDLTAWGIPHFVLITSFVLVLLMAVAIHMTAQSPRQWSFGWSPADVLPLLMFATIFLVWNQFWITEFDSGPRILSRPLWLLPVLIAAGPAFIGTLANHSLRRFGAATISGVLALALRSALIALFDVQDIMFADAWILALPVCVAVDLALVLGSAVGWKPYGYNSSKPSERGLLDDNLPFQPASSRLFSISQRPAEVPVGAASSPWRLWIIPGIAAALVMSVVTATIMGDFYALYPARGLPFTTLMLLVGCLATAWIGTQVGSAFASGSREAETESASTRWPLFSLGAVMIVALFVVFFVTTAAPPV